MSAKKSTRPSMKRKSTKPAARKKIGKKNLARHGAAQQARAKTKSKPRAARKTAATEPGVVYSDLRRSMSESFLGRLLGS